MVDLLTALQEESLARAGGDQSAAPKPRKSSAKKTPAKKTAA